MQNKLVENWLTSAKELSFTTPFVQLLTKEGYAVIQSNGGPTEQGKDIIAYDKKGALCCFQLKCGDIGSSEWQKYRAQFADLTEIPPKHASFKKVPIKWNCYLVTNGNIKGQTNQTIIDYSAANKRNGKMPLGTISKDELLIRFTNAFGEFFPIEPDDIRIFFEMYCQPGDNTLNRQEFKEYFENYFLKLDGAKSKQKKIEAINASLILASYLLTNKYDKENNFAIIDAWVLLLLTILHFATKWNLKDKEFELCESLILDEIDTLFRNIIIDVSEDQKNLVEATYGIFSEPFMTYRLRCAEILGYTAACINYSILANRPAVPIPIGLQEKLKLAVQKKMIISEFGMPYMYNVVLSSAINSSLNSAVSELKNVVDGVLQSNEEEGEGLPSPYYSMTEVISHMLGVKSIKESFKNRSYTLWPAILMLAKYNQRAYLNDNWCAISQISMLELVAHEPNDLLLWRVRKGDLFDSFPAGEQSWGELQKISNLNYDNEIPPALLHRKYLIPLMLLVMPHRVSPRFVLSLVNK